MNVLAENVCEGSWERNMNVSIKTPEASPRAMA
jgi:hypothetical protein